MNRKERRQSGKEERKQKIREKYKGVDPALLEELPPDNAEVHLLIEQRRNLRVAAYCRVSTDDENQTSSYELQINYYRDMIEQHDGWEFAGVYADEGISETSVEHRTEFQRLRADCEAGKIDMIITKSISRFARNTVDSLRIQAELAELKHPVAVYFETERINSMDQSKKIIMTVLSATAEEESHVKSDIMNASLRQRFKRGIFLTPELLGYDKDEDGNLVVNEEEADTVRLIYYLYLGGFSTRDIAEILTGLNRETKLGNTVWNPGSVMEILQNERHCGDVVSWKTYTPNFLTHKKKKNTGVRPRVRQADHHEAIIDRSQWNAAQRMIEARKYSAKGYPLPSLQVVDEGMLRGFVSVNRTWTGFSEEDYLHASRSVYVEGESQGAEPGDAKAPFSLPGYQVVRAQFFSTRYAPAMTISGDRLRFNTACLRKFEDVEYVELLINSVEKCIAIRPCDKENPNAIRWGTLREDGRWAVLSKSCHGFARPLYTIMDWNPDFGYRMRGQFVEHNGDKLMMFDLSEPEIIVREETDGADAVIVLPDEAEAEPATSTGVVKDSEVAEENRNLQAIGARKPRCKAIILYPLEWVDSFGNDTGKLRLLERIRYSGNWDVLRPTKAVKGVQDYTMLNVDSLMDMAQELIDKMRCAG